MPKHGYVDHWAVHRRAKREWPCHMMTDEDHSIKPGDTYWVRKDQGIMLRFCEPCWTENRG